MARILLVAPAAADVQLDRTCLGLLRALDRRGVKVGFVKPVAQLRADGGPDRSAALVAAITQLQPPDPVATAKLEQQLGEGGLDVVLETIVATAEPVCAQADVVIVEAVSPGPSIVYTSGLNQALARALDADVLIAGRWPADTERPANPHGGSRVRHGRGSAAGVDAPACAAGSRSCSGDRRWPGRASRYRRERVRVWRGRARDGLCNPRPAHDRPARGTRTGKGAGATRAPAHRRGAASARS